MKIQLAVETSFQQKYGGRTTHHLNGIMEHATRLYGHSSLGTRLKLVDGGHIDGGSVAETERGCGREPNAISDVGLM